MSSWHLSIDQPDTAIPKHTQFDSRTWMHTNTHSSHALFLTGMICHKILSMPPTVSVFHDWLVRHNTEAKSSRCNPGFIVCCGRHIACGTFQMCPNLYLFWINLMYRLHFIKPVPPLKTYRNHSFYGAWLQWINEWINLYYAELCTCNTIYLWTYKYVYTII